MSRPPAISAEEKSSLILMILSGDLSVAEAAVRAKVTTQAVSNWRRQFITFGMQGLDGGDRQATERERRLSAEIIELKKALGEVYIQLRALRGTQVQQRAPVLARGERRSS